jgi:hypothetical protein
MLIEEGNLPFWIETTTHLDRGHVLQHSDERSAKVRPILWCYFIYLSCMWTGRGRPIISVYCSYANIAIHFVFAVKHLINRKYCLESQDACLSIAADYVFFRNVLWWVISYLTLVSVNIMAAFGAISDCSWNVNYGLYMKYANFSNKTYAIQ